MAYFRGIKFIKEWADYEGNYLDIPLNLIAEFLPNREEDSTVSLLETNNVSKEILIYGMLYLYIFIYKKEKARSKFSLVEIDSIDSNLISRDPPISLFESKEIYHCNHKVNLNRLNCFLKDVKNNFDNISKSFTFNLSEILQKIISLSTKDIEYFLTNLPDNKRQSAKSIITNLRSKN